MKFHNKPNLIKRGSVYFNNFTEGSEGVPQKILAGFFYVRDYNFWHIVLIVSLLVVLAIDARCCALKR